MPEVPTASRTVELSVAAPAFNEADNIAAAVGEWRGYLEDHPAIGAWEIVVCDDGSTDATRAILEDLRKGCPELVVVGFERNRGAGAAIAAAIAATRLDWVVLLDSDGQFPISNLDGFLDRVRAGEGTAFSGARIRKADGLRYRWGSALSGAVGNLLHRTRYRDFNSIFKVVYGPLFRTLPLESGGMNCSTEITARVVEVGHDWIEIPIEHRERGGGSRGWRFWRGARDRALFVGYLGYRRWLLRMGVLRPPALPAAGGPADPPLEVR
ncbi:glycosyltransferase family 2 protein [Planomonospora venezuelensis]|uniref:Glycosyltransferase involved in cell wall biosynthesis n=1 Tax=Planomonospora venezuelensis TaxID=1999 RepID=A0A841D313_PLAVE|nr:glycosyltransferase family 2 protein [Planomonospora venezuelensis]MBB5963363.1 glycosyltransferase involved in cell wall biosynthesis [Planomonospora venezuelensis]